MGRHKAALAVAVIGAVVLTAHIVLGAVSSLSAGQWQSGAIIGLVLLVGGGVAALRTR